MDGKYWASPVEFIGLDYENHQPPYIVTALEDIDLGYVPLYAFKEDVAKACVDMVNAYRYVMA